MQRCLFIAFFSIFLCFIPQELRAFDIHIKDDKSFTAKMEELLKVYNIPSVSACILKKGKNGIWDIAWEGTYGYRIAIRPRIRADQDTIYAIGSITKTFTATAVMQLVEKGLIDLDEDVSTYMPFPIKNPGLNYNDPDDPVPPITVRYLLSHRSGLPKTTFDFFTEHKDLSYLDFGVFRNIDELRVYLSRKESWARADPDKKGKIYYKPGEKYCYSNVGYLILGFLIEQVINKDTDKRITWKQYIIKNILAPLGMRNTKFYWLDYPRGTNLAQGYIEKRFVSRINPDYPLDALGKLESYTKGVPIYRYILVPENPALMNPTAGILYNTGGAAGQMLSTASDLAYFMVAHLNKGKGYARDKDGHVLYDKKHKPAEISILSQKSIRAMHNVDDSGLCEITDLSKSDSDLGLSRLTGYGLGWMRVNWGGRYWNYPWNPGMNPQKGVDWKGLRKAGVKRRKVGQVSDVNMCNGLDVEGNAGDLPGYHAEMYQVSDDLAIICLTNEDFSEETRDESRMQPRRFKHYTTDRDEGKTLKDVDGAFPHNWVKYSEIEYLLLQKAASLN
ncbi:MAG: serine hydrolase domain-containing protein [Thermodesulfobacteriota bacterium]|nr:serine hydrolase domain-containing protein [Thermodesulfobacteriota bacterium]